MSNIQSAILSIVLDREAGEPMHVQLTEALRDIILTKPEAIGAPLPPSRMFAAELGVSRTTVLTALDQLTSEGYLESRGGSGVFVSTDLEDPTFRLATKPRDGGRKEGSAKTANSLRPFRTALPDLRLFPHAEWARLLEKHWRDPGEELMLPSDLLGHWPLREAIAEHLTDWRGIDCAPDNIVVTSGFSETIQIIAQALFQPGDRIFLEDPGYALTGTLLTGAGMQLAYVPVDEEGARIDQLRRADGIVLSPTRHYPIGVGLPVGRRLAVLEWAAENKAIIVEDDYDSEFRYHGTPQPALSSLDSYGCSIYVGSFSKVFHPGIRLAYMVLPDRFVAPVEAHLASVGQHASIVPQPPLADFMKSGAFATHIRKMRRVYRQRQDALLTSMDRHLAGLMEGVRDTAGMHLVGRLAPDLEATLSDETVADLAASVDVALRPVSSFRRTAPVHRGLLFGYAAFTPEEMDAAAERLGAVLRKVRQP